MPSTKTSLIKKGLYSVVGLLLLSYLFVDDGASTRALAGDAATQTSKRHLQSMKKCQATGDPHVVDFDGKKFDNHEKGWQIYYKTPTILIELEHGVYKHKGTWDAMIAKGYRVWHNGVIVQEGEMGVEPADDFTLSPENVRISIKAMTLEHKFPQSVEAPWYYNIFLESPDHDTCSGICCGSEAFTDAPTLPPTTPPTPDPTAAPTPNPTATPTTAPPTPSPTDAPVTPAPTAAPTNAPIPATPAPTIDLSTNNQITTEIAEAACAELLGKSQFANCVADNRILDDLTMVTTTVENTKKTQEQEDAFNTGGGSTTGGSTPGGGSTTGGSTPGGAVNGDPIIQGLNGDVFKFEGRSGAWYSAVSSKAFQWNMKFQQFEGCPVKGDTFTTGFGLTLFDPSGTQKLHDIEIDIVNEHHTGIGCGGRTGLGLGKSFGCLGGGSLELVIDGEKATHALNHEFNGGRIIAFNTVAACSRRWFDFDVTPASDIGHLGGAISPLASHRRRLSSVLHSSVVLDTLSTVKKTMVSPEECDQWLNQRRLKNDIFTRTGRWSTIIIETETVSFHIEYKQETERCEAHNLDVWISKVDPSVVEEQWEGIIGETKGPGVPSATESHNVARSEALKFANDVDYEVISPFSNKCNACVERE